MSVAASLRVCGCVAFALAACGAPPAEPDEAPPAEAVARPAALEDCGGEHPPIELAAKPGDRVEVKLHRLRGQLTVTYGPAHVYKAPRRFALEATALAPKFVVREDTPELRVEAAAIADGAQTIGCFAEVSVAHEGEPHGPPTALCAEDRRCRADALTIRLVPPAT